MPDAGLLGDSHRRSLDPPPRPVLRAAASPWRTWRSAINSWSSSAPPADHVSLGGTGSSGSGCQAGGRMAVQSRHRATGHRPGLAPPRLPALLAVEVQANPVGRPRLDAELRALIRRMARDNPTWGRRRIQAELALLGYEVAELTVAKYMHRTATHPSPTWRAFLASHARDIVAVDFFLVPTLTYRLLFAFVVLRHHRRELLHLHVTDQPTAVWTARHILEAFPNETAPRYLLRDRDAIYGERFTRCLANMGIRDVIIAPGAPWQNAFAERVIGSIRRECLDHVIILSEAHLAASYAPISPTTTPHDLTNRSPTTVPSHEWSNPRPVAGSSPCLRSVGSITATSAPPDHRDRDSLWLAPSTVASAAGSPCGPSHLRREDLPRSWTIEPSVEPPRHWRR